MSNEGKKKETAQVTFRLPVTVLDKLDFLCKSYGMKRGDVIISMINAEYDKLCGSPELREMLDKFLELGNMMKDFAEKE